MKFIVTTGFLLTLTFSSWAQKAVRYFEAQRISDQSIQLNWITSAGLTCPDLFIERSTDLSNFTEVYRHSGVCGSTFEEISYFWVDNEALPGVSYYRIQESFGQYPDTIKVFNPSGNAEVFMYPNPASDKITIYRADQLFNEAFLSIYQSDGRLILTTQLMDQSNTLDISTLNKGLYYFQYATTVGIITRKVMISAVQNR
jgi:hypothetical protein